MTAPKTQKNDASVDRFLAGVTDEQDIGLFFKRLRVLQGLFGDADHHVDRFQRLPAFNIA